MLVIKDNNALATQEPGEHLFTQLHSPAASFPLRLTPVLCNFGKWMQVEGEGKTQTQVLGVFMHCFNTKKKKETQIFDCSNCRSQHELLDFYRLTLGARHMRALVATDPIPALVSQTQQHRIVCTLFFVFFSQPAGVSPLFVSSLNNFFLKATATGWPGPCSFRMCSAPL